jgi:hypothetical protein
VNEAALSEDGKMLYGMQGEFQGSQVSLWRITPNGLEFAAAGPSFTGLLYATLKCGANICVTSNGAVVQASTLNVIANLSGGGLIELDLGNNRIFTLSQASSGVLAQSFDATTFQPTGQFAFALNGTPYGFARASGDQLAIASTNELILLPISMMTSNR